MFVLSTTVSPVLTPVKVVPLFTVVLSTLVGSTTIVSKVFVLSTIVSAVLPFPVLVVVVVTSPPSVVTVLSIGLVVIPPSELTVALLPPPSTNTPSIKPAKIASLIVRLVPGKTVLADIAVSVPDKLTIATLPAASFAAAVAAAAS